MAPWSSGTISSLAHSAGAVLLAKKGPTERVASLVSSTVRTPARQKTIVARYANGLVAAARSADTKLDL
jgi:hypothetical protein